jgi:hypothetical protein
VATGSTWCAPGALAWWIGVLFAIGSLCFALGAFPLYATSVGVNADNVTYFIGSIFFTTAAFSATLEVGINQRPLVGWSSPTTPAALRGSALPDRLVGEPHPTRRDPVVQPTTFSALVVGLGASSAHHPVWRPDALGSICFLVSSWRAWAEECHGAFAWCPRDLAWWISFLNLVGSVAFGVSAIASYVKPNGELLSLALTNLGTFVGAVCFLVGGVLLLPDRTSRTSDRQPLPGVSSGAEVRTNPRPT